MIVSVVWDPTDLHEQDLTRFAVGLWDASKYFRTNKDDSLVYRHEMLTSLPRCTEELRFGDLALVYYCASTYQSKSGGYFGLSHNLYGVALIAHRKESAY